MIFFRCPTQTWFQFTGTPSPKPMCLDPLPPSRINSKTGIHIFNDHEGLSGNQIVFMLYIQQNETLENLVTLGTNALKGY